MAKFELASLYGGATEISFPSSDPATPIVVVAHYPNEIEIGLALESAGVEPGENLSISQNFEACVAVSRYCIESVKNLDDWPQPAREASKAGTERLNEAAWLAIPKQVAFKVGQKLLEESPLSKKK